MRSAQKDRDGTITINGSVNAAGAIQAGTGFAVTKTGTGAYTLRFPPMRTMLSCAAAPLAGAFIGSSIGAGSSNIIAIVTYNSAAAPLDLGFTFSATGLAA